MADLVYSTEAIYNDDLVLLKDLALGFLRNTTYCAKFQDLLLCITLCQGAANHYAVCHGYAKRYFDSTRIGVKDFDIWFFFRKEEGRIFNPRWIGRQDLGCTKFGKNPDDVGFTGRRIDFIGRSITLEKMNVEDSVKHWLQSAGGASPKHLSQKAVVGLYPHAVLGKVIWINPELA
jgi:hypothetical protein